MKKNTYFLEITTSLLLNFLIVSEGFGQIVPDRSLGTEVNLKNNTFTIKDGTQVGGNLFHSFSEFSIPKNGIAEFKHLSNVNNIINRVTGKAISNIDGTIKASGNANVILLNPNGIVFGLNSRLDINGSFLATTATSLKFTDGREFSTTNVAGDSLLTMNIPMGLQFGNNPGTIINRSTSSLSSPFGYPIGLQVDPGKTLALVGGNLQQDKGGLLAEGGRIELGSVGDNSFVTLTPIEQGWGLSYEGVTNFQDILFSQLAGTDATGAGGTIRIQGRRITITGGYQLGLNSLEQQSTGDLIINASESVELSGFGILPGRQQLIASGLYVQAEGVANGGNIIINTQRMTVKDGAIISTGTIGQGQGGKLILNASKLVEILGTSVSDPTSLESGTVGLGNAGDIIIDTERLIVGNGARVIATTGAEGRAGNVTIQASDSVEVAGQGTVRQRNQTIQISSLITASSGLRAFNRTAQGDGGNIDINTDRLIVRDKGEISVDSFRSGAAGNMTLAARSISLENNAKLNAVSETLTGSGGNISLNASDFLSLRNSSNITATAGLGGGGGNGGNININTQFIFAVPSENSDIAANAFTGQGGSVNMMATGIYGITFREEETILSDITVSSEFGQSGVFVFNRPDVDPQSGLINLSVDVVDTDNLVVQACGAGGELTAGEFTITGRGGLPVDYNQTVDFNQGLPDFGDSNSSTTSNPSTISLNAQNNASEPIIEAQGWIMNEKGQVVLTAQAPKATPGRSDIASTKCR